MTSRKQNFKFQCGEFPNPRNVLLKAETCRYPPNVFSSTLTGEGEGGEKIASTIVIRILAVRLLCKAAISFTVTLK